MIVVSYILSLALFQYDTHLLISPSEFCSMVTLVLSLCIGLKIDMQRILWILAVVSVLVLSVIINIGDYNKYTLFLNSKHWLQLLIMIGCFKTFMLRLQSFSKKAMFYVFLVGIIFQFSSYFSYLYDHGLFNRIFSTNSLSGMDRFHYMSPNIFILLLLFYRREELISVIFIILYFGVSQSRQSLAILLLILSIEKILPLLRLRVLTFTVIGFGLFWRPVMALIASAGLVFGLGQQNLYRIHEIQNILSSKSFWVRSFDTLYVINDVRSSSVLELFFGKGMGKIYDIPRPGISFGVANTDIKVMDYLSPFSAHSPDFLFSLLLIDGGIVLLFVFIYFLYKEILTQNVSYNIKVFSVLFLALAVGSTHVIYNPIYLFILLFILTERNGAKAFVFYR